MAETKINKNQAGIGVFTEDNLVGGTNVTLTDETIISGGGIDSHTVLMLHCDDNLTDSSQYASTATINNYASGSTSYVEGKFDKAVRNNQANWFFATNDTAFLPVRQLTLDFWTYLAQSSSSININIHSAGGGNAVRFYYWSGNGTINIESFNDVGSASASLTSADYDKFHHIAITFDTNKLIKLYMDGTLKATLDVSASEYGLSQGIDEVSVSCESTSRYSIFDELRLSDNIRYTGDFTPEEVPYSTNTQERTVKAINCDLDIDNNSITKNSSDKLQTVGVIDQNNTSNAIKTWTGTKAQYDAIVTKDADTIYNITDDTVLTEFANTSLSNLSNAGKIVGARLGMPSKTYIDLTLGATDSTYTAPADGYFDLRKAGDAGQFGRMGSRLETGATLASNEILSLFLPVCKGEVMTLRYSLTGTTYVFRFVYAEGSKSEAN